MEADDEVQISPSNAHFHVYNQEATKLVRGETKRRGGETAACECIGQSHCDGNAHHAAVRVPIESIPLLY